MYGTKYKSMLLNVKTMIDHDKSIIVLRNCD